MIISNIIIKPVGSTCNLDCSYCFYKNKKTKGLMSDEILSSFIKQYNKLKPLGILEFAFQGGEPMLAGIDFFKNVLKLQKELNRDFTNSIQTNGILLNREWCEFLRDNKFLVGISLDGPKEIHNKFRGNSYSNVENAINLLKEYGVEFNILCCVNSFNVNYPTEIYRLFINLTQHIQFIPIVGQGDCDVLDVQYGNFLKKIFNLWIKNDIGFMFIQNFEQCLVAWTGKNPTICIQSKTCGNNLVLESNGDLYSCDHFVDEQHKLGNILEKDINILLSDKKQDIFGNEKSNFSLSCLKCEYLFVCHGGCPKDRLNGCNKLCNGYKTFFKHIKPYMQKLAFELRQNVKKCGRNDLCPCGSGKKFKNCHMY